MPVSIRKSFSICVVSLCVLLSAVLLFGSGTALAAAPEEPETSIAEPVTNTTAVLHGTVNPKASAAVTWFFQYREGGECGGAGASTTAAVPAEGVSEVEAQPAEAKIAGLKPGTQYTFCLVARNEAEETTVGDPVSLTTTTLKPVVTEESLASATSTEATFGAQINPEGLPTSFKVEYGTSEPFGSSAEATLPAAEGAVGVSAHLTGLAPGTAYHFRFVAHSALGGTPGADVPFATAGSLGPSELALPDDRTYELVSATGNQEVYVPLQGEVPNEDTFTGRPFRASDGGVAVSYVGDPPASGEGGSGSTGRGLGNQYLAMHTSAGWSARVITPSGGGLEGRYEAFSGDLSVGVLFEGITPLAAGAPVNCGVLYSRTNDDADYRPFFTAAQTSGRCQEGEPVLFAGASADSSHFFFQSPGALTSEATVAEGEGKENLYESVDGQLRSVNVLGGVADPNATFGGPKEPENEGDLPDFSNAISADGTRVFWTDLNDDRLYVRVDGASTVPVSTGPARFWTASRDGRYAFYTEGEKLLRFDLQSETREELAGAGAGAQGVIGVNEEGEDGGYVYFVADGELASNANANHEEAVLGQPNLYVRHLGTTTFVVTLAPEDNHYSKGVSSVLVGDWRASLGDRTASVSPDGRHLVFESERPLTGYDNISLGCVAGPCPEVFVYDVTTGRLSCASCDPSGAPPPEHLSNGKPLSSLPLLPVSSHPTYTQRWMSDDGSRVFFDTGQPLVPQDTNGRLDVYEWEQEGRGSCPEHKPSGCIYLLSGGSSADESYFADASVTGNDVFFTTRGQLVARDHDEKIDLYDARVDGGFPEVSLACTGTGCQGVPPAPPVFASPPSVTFNGLGNFPPAPLVKPVVKAKAKSLTRAQKLAKALRACGKKPKKRRAGCGAQARRRYGPVRKAKKSIRRGR